MGEANASSKHFFLHTTYNSIGVGYYYTPQWLSESKSCLVTPMSILFFFTPFFFFFVSFLTLAYETELAALFFHATSSPFYVVSPLRSDAAPVEFSPYNLFRCKTPCRILNRKGEKNKMIVKVSLQGNAEHCCHLECNKVSINS